MKKIIYFAIVVACSMAVLSCEPKKDEPEFEPKQEAKHTSLVYMMADNDLGYGYHFDDTNERKAFYETHSLELLSAHIDENQGYMFVKYSQQAVGENNETISGSWDVISLWKIEKDNDNWKVVKIVEHA